MKEQIFLELKDDFIIGEEKDKKKNNNKRVNINEIITESIKNNIAPLIFENFNNFQDIVRKLEEEIKILNNEMTKIHETLSSLLDENKDLKDKNNLTIKQLENTKKIIDQSIDEINKLKNNIDIKNKTHQIMLKIMNDINNVINIINIDSLTGLRSKDTLMRDLSNMANTNTKYIGMIIDIDHFKKINDNFGHDTGDKILVRVGEIINSVVEQYNAGANPANQTVAYRMGGEEIGILKPVRDIEQSRVTTIEEERQYMTWLAEKISKLIKNDPKIKEIIAKANNKTNNTYNKDVVTVSIGVSKYVTKFTNNNEGSFCDENSCCFNINIHEKSNILYNAFGDKELYKAKETRDTVYGASLTDEKRKIYEESSKIKALFASNLSSVFEDKLKKIQESQINNNINNSTNEINNNWNWNKFIFRHKNKK